MLKSKPLYEIHKRCKSKVSLITKIVKMKNEFSKIKITKLRGNHKVVLSYKKKNDPREKVFDFVVKNKLSLLQMSTKTANLEDIFRKLTN